MYFVLMVRIFRLMLVFYIYIVYINSINIPLILLINRVYETQSLLSLELVSFLVSTYQHTCMYRGADKSLARPASRCILF